jgi:transposase InsO family protein
MITGMHRAEGWPVNHKRVERIWKQEGLKVPKKQPKRGRIWLNDGSCIRLRPLYKHHVWSYDFVADRTHDGRPIRMLTVLDEYSRECLAIKAARNLKSDDVLEVLTELFARYGPPAHIRSDNGAEFTANAVRDWLRDLGVKTLFIEPGSPWENGYNESFNGTLGEEVLKRGIFFTLAEAWSGSRPGTAPASASSSTTTMRRGSSPTIATRPQGASTGPWPRLRSEVGRW